MADKTTGSHFSGMLHFLQWNELDLDTKPIEWGQVFRCKLPIASANGKEIFSVLKGISEHLSGLLYTVKGENYRHSKGSWTHDLSWYWCQRFKVALCSLPVTDKTHGSQLIDEVMAQVQLIFNTCTVTTSIPGPLLRSLYIKIKWAYLMAGLTPSFFPGFREVCKLSQPWKKITSKGI